MLAKIESLYSATVFAAGSLGFALGEDQDMPICVALPSLIAIPKEILASAVASSSCVPVLECWKSSFDVTAKNISGALPVGILRRMCLSRDHHDFQH